MAFIASIASVIFQSFHTYLSALMGCSLTLCYGCCHFSSPLQCHGSSSYAFASLEDVVREDDPTGYFECRGVDQDLCGLELVFWVLHHGGDVQHRRDAAAVADIGVDDVRGARRQRLGAAFLGVDRLPRHDRHARHRPPDLGNQLNIVAQTRFLVPADIVFGDALADARVFIRQIATTIRIDDEVNFRLTAENVLNRNWKKNCRPHTPSTTL